MKTMHVGKKSLFLLVTLSLMLAAASMVVSAAAKTKIQVFTYPSAGRIEWFEAGAEAFMELNPDIEVEVVNGWYSRLTVLAAGDELPDVMHMDAQYMTTMAVLGLIRPIDDLVAKDLNTSQYIPTLFDSLKYKGKLYGLPRNVDVMGLRYNRDIYQSRGMGDITRSWTWDELVSNGKKLTYDSNGDGIIDVYGFMDHWGNSLHGPNWVWMAGGEIWNADYTDTLVDSPEAIAGMQMQYDIRHTYNIAPRADDPAFSSGNPMQHFPNGQIATMMNGNSVVSSAALPFDNAVGPLPIGPIGRPVAGMMMDFIGLSARTANADAAWRLMKFLSSREGFQVGREDLREQGIYSAFSPFTTQALDQIKKINERGGEFWLAMMQVSRITNGRHPTNKFSYSKPNWNSVLAGQSVHDAMHDLADGFRRQIQELISQGWTW